MVATVPAPDEPMDEMCDEAQKTELVLEITRQVREQYAEVLERLEDA